MQNPVLRQAFLSPTRPSGETFKTVMIYDGVESLVRAKALWCRLAAQVGREPEMETTAWYSGLLAYPQWREEAAQEAAAGDMVIFSLAEKDEFPSGLQDWMKQWLPCRHSGQAAIVALMERAEGAKSQPWVAYLRQKAGESGMDFFSGQCGGALCASVVPAPAGLEERRVEVQDVFPSEFNWRGWGIND